MEINSHPIDIVSFEHHQILIPLTYLIRNAKNSISLKFFSVYTQSYEGLWHNSLSNQIYTVFPLITKAIFPCFSSFDLKSRVKIAFLVPDPSWDLISIGDYKRKVLVAEKQGLKLIEKLKGFDLLFNRSFRDYSLFFYEETHSIPLYLFNFAIGCFDSIEIPFTNGLVLKLLYNPIYKGNLLLLLQGRNLIEKGFMEIQGFFQRRYHWNRIEFSFINMDFTKEGLIIPFMFFEEELLKGQITEKKKTLWFFGFLKKITEVFLKTLCKVSTKEEISFIEEFEVILAFKTLLLLIPESIIYKDILIKRTLVNRWLEFIYDLIGNQCFKETLMSFFNRSIMFPVNIKEYSYCLKHILREKGILMNNDDFPLYKDDYNKGFLKGDLIDGNKGILIEFIGENSEICKKINGLLEISVFYNENSVKTLRFPLFEIELPYFLDFKGEILDLPKAFMGFISSDDKFLLINEDFKKLEVFFFNLKDYRLKSLIFLSFKQVIQCYFSVFFNNFIEFCLKAIDLEHSQLLIEGILDSLIDLFEENLSFNEKTRYCNLIFDRFLKRIKNIIKTIENSPKNELFPNSIIKQCFNNLLIVLYSKENLEKALTWLSDGFITIENHKISFESLDFDDFWLIMRRLYLSKDFSPQYKKEFLTNTLLKPNYTCFISEFQLISCNSAIITLENKAEIWRKSLCGEWKNKEIFNYATKDFYEGLQRDILVSYAENFFLSAEIVFISLPKDYSLIFFTNLKVHKSIRRDYLKEYEILYKGLENGGVIKELLEKEINEIKYRK